MSIYIGNKEIKHIFNGSKIVQKVYRGGVKIWEDTHLNSAGTAEIYYASATGNAVVVAIRGYNGKSVYQKISAFNNYTQTDTATWSENITEELQIIGVLSSGGINYTIAANNGLNAITKLTIGGSRSGDGFLCLTLPAMPNLTSISLASSWSEHVFLTTECDRNTVSIIKKLLPNSEYSFYLCLKN